MKKSSVLFFFIFLPFRILLTQDIPNKDILKIIDEVKSNLYKLNGNTRTKDSFLKYLNFVQGIEQERKQVYGSIAFGLNGNEVENKNLYNINTGVSIRYDNYPLEIEAAANILTQIADGKFDENLSVLNISMDYNIGKSTIHEGYAFINRSKIKFLGIDQRYEIGGGYICNVFTSTVEDINGQDVIRSTIKEGHSLIKNSRKYKKAYTKNRLKRLTTLNRVNRRSNGTQKLLSENDINTLTSIFDDYEKIFKKKYSHFRLAFLIGINREIEKTQSDLPLYGSSIDTSYTFDSTNIFRLVAAPKLEIRGGKFSWKTTCYFKQALFNSVDDEYNNSHLINNNSDPIITDKRSDYYLDLNTSFQFSLSKKLSLVADLIYVYDNAPKRRYFFDSNNFLELATAENNFTSIMFKLKYTL
ncbi:hypothetical protein MHTCC0001_21340 [Flavobacteriaceae bacterium MHTCC 0001]